MKKGKKWQALALAGMIVGVLALSGCGNEKTAVETEQPSVQEEVPQEEPTEEVPETAEENVSEGMNPTDEAEEIPQSEVTEEPEQAEEGIPAQVKYPAQISIVDIIMENEIKTNYFYDEDGDIIKVEENNPDGTVNIREIEYVLNEQGDKVYGITEEALLDTCRPAVVDNSFDKIKLTQRALIKTDQDGGSTISYDYDDAGRVTTKTKEISDGNGLIYVNGKTNYTYEEQDGNLTVTSTEKDGDGNDRSVMTLQYNSDNHLISNSLQWLDGGTISSLFQTDYEYDDKNHVTAILDTTKKPDLPEEISETVFTYDEAGNMLKKSYSDGAYEEYEGYDENGNWATCTYYHKDGNMACFLICEYDETGKLITKSFGIGDESREAAYHYDENGRLDNISVDGIDLYQFRYNGDGSMERAEKVNDYTDSEAEQEEKIFFYALSQGIQQEMEAYVAKYTGIDNDRLGTGITFSYQNGAVFSY